MTMNGTQSFTFTDEQSGAIALMAEFLEAGGPESMVLIGSAGTGKTSCVKAVAAAFKGSIAFTAPTNKAAKVLRQSLKGTGREGMCCTIYSLLGLRLEANGEIKELTVPDTDIRLDDVDAVVVDEGSMVNEKLFRVICSAQKLSKVPFLFMGDAAQLPPVKELTSPIWGIERQAKLTKVMRHDNQILKLAQTIRAQTTNAFGSLSIRPDFDLAADEGVWVLSKPEFDAQMIAYAKAGRFTSGDCKAIAWRNVVVDKMNWMIRDSIMGATPLPLEVGDRIIATSPCMSGEKGAVALMHTDDEAGIIALTEDFHPWFPTLKIMHIQVEKDTGSKPWLRVIHPDAKADLEKELKALADAAKLGERWKWRKFWELKEAFHEIKPAYAITSHRSQGSTYHTTFVNYKDILCNPNRTEAMRCLYVACTRSQKRLVLTAG